MSRIFVSSDLHFGHNNIIRYASRPFKGTADMDSYLIDEWNRRVPSDSIVYFLGDFAMGPRVDDGFIADKLRYLHGEIRVVLGNHDQPAKKWGMSGLKQVVEDHRLGDKVKVLEDIHEFAVGGQRFVACHYPMSDWNGKFHGVAHLHGHCHSVLSKQKPRDLAKMKKQKIYDIGVDMYGGPVELTDDRRFLDDPQGWNV